MALPDIKDTGYYRRKKNRLYMKYHYYKLKHQVFRALGYECAICGHADPDHLQLHHADDEAWYGIGGRDRFLKAKEKIDQGETDELELNCFKCHDLRDADLSKEEIIEYLEDQELSHKEICEEENITNIRNGWRDIHD